MRLDKVDLNLFMVFDSIYSERSLTRAATLLHITQPAVSNALNRLRESFNDALFVRHGRGMRPTPVADNIYPSVRDALRLLQRSIQEGAAFDPHDSQRIFRLSMNDLSEFVFLPPLMQALNVRAPRLAVQSYYLGRRDIARALASGELDFAFDVPLANDLELESIPLSSQQYVCVLRRDHPMVGRRLTLKQYLAQPHLHVSSRPRGEGHVEFALSKLGVQRNIALRVQHYLVAPAILNSTDMLWTVPRQLAAGLGLRVVELPFELATLDTRLYWHKSATGDKANQWMRQCIIDSVEGSTSARRGKKA